ncbi:hypothetical protein [Thioclava sediminum]|uniref:hypothetical protein n=1 Tax=Thioclava sediminum TaxID=1915319 RepID=UPI0013150094|nr:hypothetical protein [Thioclava sediminum]
MNSVILATIGLAGLVVGGELLVRGAAPFALHTFILENAARWRNGQSHEAAAQRSDKG